MDDDTITEKIQSREGNSQTIDPNNVKVEDCTDYVEDPEVLQLLLSNDAGTPGAGTVCNTAEDTATFDKRSNRAKIKKEFQCFECQRTFTAQTSFDEHMRTHLDEETYHCRTCMKAFDSKTGLLNHMRIHIANQHRTYKCAVCENTFETNKDLKEHKSAHAGVTFSCNLAKKCSGLTFKDHCEYWYHELTHNKTPKPKCIECGIYINCKYMKTHILTHFDRAAKCDICGGTYGNLEKHMKTHGQEIQCVECGKLFKEKGALKLHMMTHTGVRRYQCLYCGKGFITTQARRNHTLLHTDEKPFECEVCGLRSRIAGDARRHRRTHDKEKRFQCDYCQKMFFHKESVLAHIRSHTKSRLYECTLCDFTTATKTGLRSHMTYKHVSAKPFACAVCGLAFKVRSQLGRHNLSKAHRNKAYGAMKNMKAELGNN